MKSYNIFLILVACSTFTFARADEDEEFFNNVQLSTGENITDIVVDEKDETTLNGILDKLSVHRSLSSTTHIGNLCPEYPASAKWCYKACDAVKWAHPSSTSRKSCSETDVCSHKATVGWDINCHSRFKIHPHPNNLPRQKAKYCRTPNLPCSYKRKCRDKDCKTKALNQRGYCPKMRCTQLYYNLEVHGVWASPLGIDSYRKTNLYLRIPGGCRCMPREQKVCSCRNHRIRHFFGSYVPEKFCRD